MLTFSGFEEYQVSEWVSGGLVTRAVNIVSSVTASLKSAGSIVAVALAVASAPSLAVERTTVAAFHTEVSAAASESMRAVEHVNRMSREIEIQIGALDHVTKNEINPDTLSLAEKVIAMMNSGNGAPSADWAARVALGKA